MDSAGSGFSVSQESIVLMLGAATAMGFRIVSFGISKLTMESVPAESVEFGAAKVRLDTSIVTEKISENNRIL